MFRFFRRCDGTNPLGSRWSEADMFVTIRRYSPKNGSVNKASLELLRRQIQDDFLPAIREIPGFRAYYLLNVENREVLTLSFCDTHEAAEQSSRCAADYTLRNPLVYELGRPEITESEVLTYAEAPRGTAGDDGDAGRAVASALALWLGQSRGILLSASEP
jgi:heme-degrading monooxygenase HmoA